MFNFFDPVPEGINTVYVLGCKPKCGTTTVAGLVAGFGHTVKDMGVDVETTLTKLTAKDALIYIVDTEQPNPEWMFYLSFTHVVLTIDFSQLYFDETTWQLMQTDHELLKELEALLPADNPVRVLRNQIRSNNNV